MTSGFGYEIDFLPVGEGEKSGDAIAMRYGTPGNYKIHVVDGGTAESGQALVEHIRRHYGNPEFIDYVVLTHGDDDHSSGLRTVIESFKVGSIFMNRPWDYAGVCLDKFKDRRWTQDGLSKRLRDDFPILDQIDAIATERGIPIYRAVQGTPVGAFVIAAPSVMRYTTLLPEFSKTPEAREAAPRAPQNALAALNASYPTTGTRNILAEILRPVVEAGKAIEDWFRETLGMSGDTGASNESSVIQYADFGGGHTALLTADAGPDALQEAISYLASRGNQLPGLNFIQAPHHGSRRNINPHLLNRLVGPIAPRGQVGETVAFISASKSSSTHPRKIVVNGFIRRGVKVFATKGQAIWHRRNMPARVNYSDLTPLEFSNEVEA